MEIYNDMLKKIEMKRNEMIFLGNTFGLSSTQTIQCSQELDNLLNLYQIIDNNLV